MGYKVPDWKKSIGQDKFDVEVDGKTYSLPKVEYLTGEQAERMDLATSGVGSIYAFLDELAEGLGTALRPVPVKFTREFVQAWQKDSALGVGESGASAGS